MNAIFAFGHIHMILNTVMCSCLCFSDWLLFRSWLLPGTLTSPGKPIRFNEMFQIDHYLTHGNIFVWSFFNSWSLLNKCSNRLTHRRTNLTDEVCTTKVKADNNVIQTVIFAIIDSVKNFIRLIYMPVFRWWIMVCRSLKTAGLFVTGCDCILSHFWCLLWSLIKFRNMWLTEALHLLLGHCID